MAFWAAIPMIASMASSAFGGKAEAEGTIEGARTTANIEKINRDYLTKTFDEDIERQMPFYEAGLRAGVKYPSAVTNKLDPTQSGAYKTKLGLIEKDLEGAPEYVREGAIKRLGAVEGEKQKGRLMDLQQIGLGAAGSAGTSGLNLGTMLAQSYGLSGNVMAAGTQSKEEQTQSAWNVAASQLGGIPSYLASRKEPTPKRSTPRMDNTYDYGYNYGGMGGV